MAKKYDTNPLEREVFERGEREFARQSEAAETSGNINAPTAFFEANTRPFAGQTLKNAEQQTANFDEFNPAEPYKSVLNNPMSGAPVSQAVQYHVEPPTSRNVLGLGIPENVAMILPYLPFTIGGIAAVIELVRVSRTETRVRFHAAQGLALNIAYLLISVLLAFISNFSDAARLGSRFFSLAAIIFFGICIYRVWQGKSKHIEALDDLTDFLNDKLKPKK